MLTSQQHGIKRVSLSAEAKRLKLEKDKSKIAHYKQLTENIFSLRNLQTYTVESLKETTQILQINPEFYTMWNYRREIFEHLKNNIPVEDYAQLMDNDLKMLMVILKRFPKVYWIWNHRRWCLFELVKINRVDWQYEYAVVSKLLELDSRNYHGWQYRRFVVQNMQIQATTKAAPASKNEESLVVLGINIEEFKYTTSKINKNFSNFSAWHNRSTLIPKIYNLYLQLEAPSEKLPDVYDIFKLPRSILTHELELIKTGMYMDSEDTSIWLYMWWLLTEKFFTDELRKEDGAYLAVLEEQLANVEELNELEKSDHIYHWDNCWCLKTIILVKGLIQQEHVKTNKSSALLTQDIKNHIQALIEIDPLRKGKYLDQLEGKASIIPIL